ncbi:regulator [Streptomyces cavernae]|uniref:regulator n=1 Tax=Streptomyces cavernae TaxID=2259034 RepID=UPI000FEB8448|nr:regulator [Streptomyces cavernae]
MPRFRRTATAEKDLMPLPLWVRGDTNAFFGLGVNVLVNVLTLTGLCIGVVKIPGDDVFHTILPALGIALIIGNVYYAYLGRRLARREGRPDVTAMPYGPSVPHMFIVVFVIMLPVYLKTKDPLLAWKAGIAWAFIIGVIVLIGAFIGPYIRRYAPRAALLGTLAGISVSFISMRPAGQMWDQLWIALPVFLLLLVGLMTDIKLPGNIPIGLAALLVGTAIGWAGGAMSGSAVSAAVDDITFALPGLHLDTLFSGLSDVAPLLATAIPLGVYNFTEGMTNVESAAAAGDSYNLRSILLADGAGAVVGAALGSPFPPAVYVGHPGWKAAGGRTGYSFATGAVIALMCFVGMFGLLGAIFPVAAIVPILLYIGLLIGAQAFQFSPKAHAAAVVAALIPNLASWAVSQVDNALAAAGTSAAKVGDAGLESSGVVYHGLMVLGQGAILAGLILGAFVAFVIDKRFVSAGVVALAGAALSFVGLIHAPQVGWNENGGVSLGYLLAAVLCGAFALTHPEPRVPDAEELALDRLHGGPAAAEVAEPAPKAEPEPVPDSVSVTAAPAEDDTAEPGEADEAAPEPTAAG